MCGGRNRARVGMRKRVGRNGKKGKDGGIRAIKIKQKEILNISKQIPEMGILPTMSHQSELD